jgi:putative heme-binding domain-containing protein
LQPAITAARQIAADRKAPTPLRVSATSLLGRQISDQNLLSGFLTTETPSSLKLASIDTLARIAPPNLPATLLQNWTSHSTIERTHTIDILLRKPDWTKATLTALQNKTISPSDFDASRRQLLLTHSDPTIRKQASQIFDASSKQLDSFRPALTLKGNKTAGRKVFDQLCAVCHLPPKGLPMNGPDLRSITDRSKEGLFISILAPNQSIDPTYEGHTVTLPDGSTLFGRILSENKTHLTLRQLDGSDRQLPRKDLKSLTKTGRSLMPEGLGSAMPHQDLANLIALLQSFGQKNK